MKKNIYNSVSQGLYKPKAFRENILSIDKEAESLLNDSYRHNGDTIESYFLHTYNVHLRLHYIDNEDDKQNTSILEVRGTEENISLIEKIILELADSIQSKSLKTYPE